MAPHLRAQAGAHGTKANALGFRANLGHHGAPRRLRAARGARPRAQAGAHGTKANALGFRANLGHHGTPRCLL